MCRIARSMGARVTHPKSSSLPRLTHRQSASSSVSDYFADGRVLAFPHFTAEGPTGCAVHVVGIDHLGSEHALGAHARSNLLATQRVNWRSLRACAALNNVQKRAKHLRCHRTMGAGTVRHTNARWPQVTSFSSSDRSAWSWRHRSAQALAAQRACD